MTFKLDSDLSAVNSILGAIGQAPVTKLEFNNPEIGLVYNLLQECTVDVQTEGWQFNTEEHRYFPLNASNEVVIDKDILRASLSQDRIFKNNSFNVTIRDRKLYNIDLHTFDFSGWEAQRPVKSGSGWTYETAPGVSLDVVTLLDFDDLPAVAQRYVTYCAAQRAATQLVSNSELMQMIEKQTGLLRAQMTNFECEQANANFMGYQDPAVYQTYHPFYTLAR